MNLGTTLQPCPVNRAMRCRLPWLCTSRLISSHPFYNYGASIFSAHSQARRGEGILEHGGKVGDCVLFVYVHVQQALRIGQLRRQGIRKIFGHYKRDASYCGRSTTCYFRLHVTWGLCISLFQSWWRAAASAVQQGIRAEGGVVDVAKPLLWMEFASRRGNKSAVRNETRKEWFGDR